MLNNTDPNSIMKYSTGLNYPEFYWNDSPKNLANATTPDATSIGPVIHGGVQKTQWPSTDPSGQTIPPVSMPTSPNTTNFPTMSGEIYSPLIQALNQQKQRPTLSANFHSSSAPMIDPYASTTQPHVNYNYQPNTTYPTATFNYKPPAYHDPFTDLPNNQHPFHGVFQQNAPTGHFNPVQFPTPSDDMSHMRDALNSATTFAPVPIWHQPQASTPAPTTIHEALNTLNRQEPYKMFGGHFGGAVQPASDNRIAYDNYNTPATNMDGIHPYEHTDHNAYTFLQGAADSQEAALLEEQQYQAKKAEDENEIAKRRQQFKNTPGRYQIVHKDNTADIEFKKQMYKAALQTAQNESVAAYLLFKIHYEGLRPRYTQQTVVKLFPEDEGFIHKTTGLNSTNLAIRNGVFTGIRIMLKA